MLNYLKKRFLIALSMLMLSLGLVFFGSMIYSMNTDFSAVFWGLVGGAVCFFATIFLLVRIDDVK